MLILLCVIIVSIIKFFGQNWHIIEISIFDFGRNLITVSINYDIYEEKVYDIWHMIHVYTYGLYKVSMF